MASADSIRRKANFIDLSGKQFNCWTVLHEVSHPGSSAYWLCRCKCGRERVIRGDTLRNGTSRMCDHCKNMFHGMDGTPEYRAWIGMISRCNDPSVPCYSKYGGRGICVCQRWMSFQHFLSDMGTRPSPQHSIDRIDNDGNYEPGNCRWATKKQQSRNIRSNRLLTLNGQTKCVSEWAEFIGIKRTTLDERLRHGWSIEDALTLPIMHCKSHSKSRR